MTERLYCDDAYRLRFEARVAERLDWQDQPAVVLEHTAFYPTGGGQPHDLGMLNGVDLVDVVEREEDGAVIHVLAGPLKDDKVEGQVDWERRFDLMQQHSGQHVLSAAFVEVCGANTVGFHLSDEYSTIDLDRAPLSAEDLSQVERLANRLVEENRQVVSRFVPDDGIAALNLRKAIVHEGPVRIVEVPGFDCSACGGTHVRTTGEIGLIKITRSERHGTETRAEFLCGRRALADYQAKNVIVMDLACEYTVGPWDLPDMVHRMTEELKGTRRELRRTRDGLLDVEAMALWHGASTEAGYRIVQAHLAGRAPDDLKHLAQRLVANPQTVALLGVGGPGEKGFFCFARSTDLDLHMGSLVRQACQTIGGGGGGRPEFAQGGGPEGAKVAVALDEAFEYLVSQ